tara:strand:- start:236 stop:682 length:447 start_codon:yes stop_codon:yes gene_type:complete
MIKQISIKTKFGWISAFEQNNKIYKVKFGKCKNKSISKNLKQFKFSLNNFLTKKSKFIKFNTLIEGNSIQKKVWNELKKIKFGKTKSYGDIAKKYNLSPRHVGKICAQNKIPLAIPCHRVIKSDGSLGGFSARGGIFLKKKLLEFEKN